MPSLDAAIGALEERLTRLRDDAHVPGIAWGVVHEGALVQAGGVGTSRDGEARTPDADTVFRIASMTKSFTAAAILLLRDEGRLRLDDPIGLHVPVLRGWRGPTTDAPLVTIRDLLTMSGGLPTDDPWGDRQQPQSLEAFEALLRARPTLAWTTGTQFEYANLGYAILGRVVAAAGGQEYDELVRERLLVPLGMASTGFHEADLAADRVARGYVRRGSAFVEEGGEPYGAFAPMGGLASTVRDLAVWVAGFLDAVPARSGPGDGHPLGRAARREMQQVHRTQPIAQESYPAHEAPVVETIGYGFGLFRSDDAEAGTIVMHGGGYPGYGSGMAWHPASGLGVIALGNSRYAPVRAAIVEWLATTVRSGAVRRRGVAVLPAVADARRTVEGLLARWDDRVADAAFAMNMDLDEPRSERRAAVERLAAALGPFVPDAAREPRSSSPADLEWWLRGRAGWVRAALSMSPEPSPRIQSLELTPVPDPSAALVGVAARLVAAIGHGPPSWPPDLDASPTLDRGTIERGMAVLAARLGPLRLGLPIAGDGETRTTWELLPGPAADEDAAPVQRPPSLPGGAPATLEVVLEAASGAVAAVSLRFSARQAVPEAW